MTHDPMCPDAGEHFVSRDRYGNSMSCMCPEYARVRADERRAQYDAQSDNWIKEFSERVRADERERAAERVAAALAGQHRPEKYDYPREGQTDLYCRACADLCHSETGLMCEFPHDGAWPCEGYEDGLKLVAAARGGGA